MRTFKVKLTITEPDSFDTFWEQFSNEVDQVANMIKATLRDGGFQNVTIEEIEDE